MTPEMRRLGRGGVIAALSLSFLSGCAGQGNVETGNAAAAAATFSHSIDSATAAACALLAPGTLRALEDADGPCAEALPEQLGSASGPAASTEVYGKDAIARLATDTIFLARFPDGWRVTAAGCTRQQDGRPYDCKVKGA